ncbi:calcium/sodium antiporter [Shewanella aestuarii]|uniref:Calcium/sodium antiporter n=1 Tax=Shewanella aestuarii TaxID=1028752 RepID=A0A6G9QP80_9GAMM|nr:calcium/sodium antiporter [Shewanella aestuarii]QIR15621.1 calcium/sodium antiporter [Shewanella aestuarii]
MLSIVCPILALAVGLIALSISADRLIASSATLAKHCNVSMSFIGMTVVAFGTSAPELLVSSIAAINGAGELAIGNGIGSNIVNVGLVLGICAFLVPLTVKAHFIRRDLPILVISILFCGLLMADGHLDFKDGLLLLLGLAAYCGYLAFLVTKGEADAEEVEFLDISKIRSAVETVLMLAVLLGASQLMVWGAVELAKAAGVSELVIGLTVIAFGTSLPELAAAVAGVRRGMHDMVFATVIGSNIFNILGVIAFPALLGDNKPLPSLLLERDYPMMLLLTAIVVVAFMFTYYKQRKVAAADKSYTFGRTAGALCLVSFTGYMLYLAAATISA